MSSEIDNIFTLNTQKYTKTGKLREKNFSELLQEIEKVEKMQTVRIPFLCPTTRYKLHQYFGSCDKGNTFYTKSVDEIMKNPLPLYKLQPGQKKKHLPWNYKDQNKKNAIPKNTRCLYIWNKQCVAQVLEEYILPDIVHTKILPQLDKIIAEEKENIKKKEERKLQQYVRNIKTRTYECDECGHTGDCNEILVSVYYPMKLCADCIENDENYAGSKWEYALS